MSEKTKFERSSPKLYEFPSINIFLQFKQKSSEESGFYLVLKDHTKYNNLYSQNTYWEICFMKILRNRNLLAMLIAFMVFTQMATLGALATCEAVDSPTMGLSEISPHPESGEPGLPNGQENISSEKAEKTDLTDELAPEFPNEANAGQIEENPGKEAETSENAVYSEESEIEQMNSPKKLPENKSTGSVTVESNGSSYPTLSEALVAAAETDTLIVSGDVEVPESLALGKNITLKAAEGGGKLFKASGDASLISVQGGETFILGSGSSELLMEGIHVKVSNGKLYMKNGVHIISNLGPISIIEVSGSNSSAVFEGGVVENPNDKLNDFKNWYIVSVYGGAKVDSISGGVFKGAHVAFNVSGQGTKIESISGGSFSNSPASRQSWPCFRLYTEAQIGCISGGEFLAYRFGALQLESGASVGEISGGTFKNPLSTPVSDSSNANPYFSGLVLYNSPTDGMPSIMKPVTVNKISGGTFEGYNGLLAVGNSPDKKAIINHIMGGTFLGKVDNGLHLTQNSQIGILSGNTTATGDKNGIWNAGKIEEISGGKYVGECDNGILNVDMSGAGSVYQYFKGDIVKITGGVFDGKKTGMKNFSRVNTISNGIFKGDRYAVQCSKSYGFGNLNEIRGGTFYSVNGKCCIYLASNLILEPDLSDNQPEFGVGRYFAPEGNPIFNDETLINYPKYKDPVNKIDELYYFISSPDDTKSDVEAYGNVGFRYLRQKNTVKIKYNYNFGDTPEEQTDQYLNPGESATLWSDASKFGAAPKDCEFKGWNTKADGSGESYMGGAVVENITGDITFYAVWNKKTEDTPKTDEKTETPNDSKNDNSSQNKENIKPNTAAPKTDDKGMPFVLVLLALMSGFAAQISVKMRKRKNRR